MPLFWVSFDLANCWPVSLHKKRQLWIRSYLVAAGGGVCQRNHSCRPIRAGRGRDGRGLDPRPCPWSAPMAPVPWALKLQESNSFIQNRWETTDHQLRWTLRWQWSKNNHVHPLYTHKLAGLNNQLYNRQTHMQTDRRILSRPTGVFSWRHQLSDTFHSVHHFFRRSSKKSISY